MSTNESLTFGVYADVACKSAIYPKTYMRDDSGEFVEVPLLYTALGLAGEAGEVANKVKKILRDSEGKISDDLRKDLGDELGDVLWYVALMAKELDISLSGIAGDNNNKLMDRLKRGVIQGKGDKR